MVLLTPPPPPVMNPPLEAESWQSRFDEEGSVPTLVLPMTWLRSLLPAKRYSSLAVGKGVRRIFNDDSVVCRRSIVDTTPLRERLIVLV